MKQITIARFTLTAILFIVGVLSILCAFGEDELPLFPFFIIHIGLVALGLGAFYMLGKLIQRWDVEDENNAKKRE